MIKTTLIALSLILCGIHSISASAQEMPSSDPAGQSGFEETLPPNSMTPDDFVEPEEMASYGPKEGTYVPYENAKYSLRYRIYYGEVIILECIGDTSADNWGDLIIPNKIEDVPVTQISYNAFKDCSAFNGSLTLPNSLTSIGYRAFYGCTGLRGTLTLPDTLTDIIDEAFYGCSGFTGNLVIPDSVTRISSGAFSDCTGFSGKLILSDNLTYLGSSVFSGCTGFTGDLILPDGLTRIEYGTFSNCSGFTGKLTLPGALTSIESWAFGNCTGLTGNLIMPKELTYIGYNAFNGCSGFNGKLVLSDGLSGIGNDAFNGCSGFTGDLILPDSLNNLGINAFNGCSGFTGDLILSNGLTSIQQRTFYGCSGFTGNLILPDSITNIDSQAFYNCNGFTGNLVLSKNLKQIGGMAFYKCSGFTGDLILPDSITEIGREAFYNCEGFTSNLILPKGMTSIGKSIFYGCDNLLNISIPNSITAIDEAAFQYCSGLTHIYYQGSKEQWDAINIESFGNDCLKNANLHYNGYYSSENMPPAFAGTEQPTTVITPTGSATPITSYNEGNYKYRTWSQPVYSYLYDNGNGLTRVEYINGTVVIENYSTDFRYQSGWTLQPELPLWGGFFAGEKYNFLIFGQDNLDEDDSIEVVRVVKYDKNWNRLSHASLRGANTTIPFNAGSLRCDEYNGILYVHTCHQMYTSSKDGLRHQANLTFSVREIDTKITDSNFIVGGCGYASHSFNQFLLTDNEKNIVTLDHGDAYPRSAVIMRYRTQAGRNSFGKDGDARVHLFAFPGPIGENNTDASLGGLAETGSGYIAAYNYLPDSDYDGIRNIHISYLPKDNFSQESVRTWTDPAAVGTTPILSSTGLEGGYVLWNNPNGADGIQYIHYDSQGNVSSLRSCSKVILSDCQPILYQGNVVWYATQNSAPVFYTLNEGGISVYDSAGSKQPTPEQQNPEQVRRFVSRMYTVALGRDAEEAGLNDWTNRLLSHETDGAGIANGFIMSDEFTNKKVSDEVYVDILYHAFFNRDADEGGRSDWLTRLAGGNSRFYVLAGFVNSVEFDNLCGQYGIIRGTLQADNEIVINPGIRKFVNRCYVKVLGREGEEAGVNDWVGRITRNEETPESVAKKFFFSEEYTNKKTSDEDFVETLYQTFMDRDSDPAGKNDWLERLAGGASREEVLEGFSRSDEFAIILRSFGL